MLKEIMDKIEGREWDWFGRDKKSAEFYPTGVKLCLKGFTGGFFSLADLLANKSWCMAVWGEECPCGCKAERKRWMLSFVAFKKLQQEGQEACLKYIKETMI